MITTQKSEYEAELHKFFNAKIPCPFCAGEPHVDFLHFDRIIQSYPKCAVEPLFNYDVFSDPSYQLHVANISRQTKSQLAHSQSEFNRKAKMFLSGKITRNFVGNNLLGNRNNI